jgi:hypothetical protein
MDMLTSTCELENYNTKSKNIARLLLYNLYTFATDLAYIVHDGALGYIFPNLA